jgi:hypothetical protein
MPVDGGLPAGAEPKSGDLFGERDKWGRSSPQRASLEAILDETRSCFAQEV